MWQESQKNARLMRVILRDGPRVVLVLKGEFYVDGIYFCTKLGIYTGVGTRRGLY